MRSLLKLWTQLSLIDGDEGAVANPTNELHLFHYESREKRA